MTDQQSKPPTTKSSERLSTLRLIGKALRITPLRYFGHLSVFVIIWSMPIIPALLVRNFFNRLETDIGWNFDTLVITILAYGVARIAILLFGMWIAANFIFRVGATVRTNLLERIYRMPGADAIDESPGQVISRFREDVDEIEEASDWTADFFGSLVFGIASAIVLVSINAQVALIVFAPVILMVIIAERLGTRIRRYRAEAREATAKITGMLGEMYGSVQSIKVAGSEQSMVDYFAMLSDQRRKVMVRDRVLHSVLESLFWNIVHLGIGVVLLVASQAMTDGTMTVGDFALFVYFLDFVTDAGFFVGLFVMRVRQADVSFDRLTATLRGEPTEGLLRRRPLHLIGDEPTPPLPDLSGAGLERLEVSNLTYRYPSTGVGVEDINLDLAKGSFTVVTGKIGSGKTTLLRAMLGLLDADTGEIAWNGVPIEDPAAFLVPPRSSYVPQVPTLFSMSLRDNLLMGRGDSEDEIRSAVRSAAFERDLDDMPNGLETLVGPLGMRLSGGQIQRTATARMFLRQTDLLVIDDLSSALDVETERSVWERLFRERSDVTALVVSHRRPALQRADTIIVLDEGRIVARGTWNELIRTNEDVRRIYEADGRTP